MRTLYKTLENYQKTRAGFDKSEEFEFFNANRDIISKLPRFSFLDDVGHDEFNIMRANILIHSYLNKKAIEEEMDTLDQKLKKGEKFDHIKIVQNLKEAMVDRPYYKEKQDKIYIAFFSRTLNAIYNYEPEKLLNNPYTVLKDKFQDSIIDPFDTYGSELFNSTFTRLIKVKESNNVTAYFHYDTYTIYFINNQGRLDNKFILFDRYLKHPSYSHMMDRIIPVIDAYFAFDKNGTINALHDQGFISSKLMYMIHKRNKDK